MTEVQEVSPEEGHLEWETPLYRTALAQYEQALPYADVEDFVAERLRFPERSLVVSVPDMQPQEFDLVAAEDVERLGALGRMGAAMSYLMFGASN